MTLTRIDQIQTVGEDTYYYPMGGAAVINYLAVTKDYKHHQYIPVEKYYYGDYILNDCEKNSVNFVRELDSHLS